MADVSPAVYGSDPAFDLSMDWCLVLVVCSMGIALLGIAAIALAAVYRTAFLPAVAFAGAVQAAVVDGDTDQLAAVLTLLVLMAAVSWGAWKLAQRCSWDNPTRGAAASSWFPVAPFSQVRESSPPLPGIVGLTNLGNTCYLNAILQCVAQEPGLVALLLDDDLDAQANVSNPLGCQGEVAAALGGLFREAWSGKRSVVDTRGFRDRAGRFRRQLMWREQQDCHELLHWLLDAVHEDLNRGDNVPGAADADSFSMRSRSPALTAAPFQGKRAGRQGTEVAIAKARHAWEQHQRSDRSPVMDRWWSMLANRLQCRGCGGLSLSFESSLCHPVTMPPAFQSVFVTLIQEFQEVGILEPDSSRTVLQVTEGRIHSELSGVDLRWLVPLWAEDAADDESADEAAWTARVRAVAEVRIAEVGTKVARAHRDAGLAAQQWKRTLEAAEATAARARSAALALLDDETASPVAKDKAMVAQDAAQEALNAIQARPITAPDPRCLPHLHADALVRDMPSCAPGPEIALTPPFDLVEPSRADADSEAKQRGFASATAMREWEMADGSRPDRRVPLECCLWLLTAPETLPLSLQWRCEGCKAPREAAKSQAWWSLPDVLVLPLQRFEHLPTGGTQKNNTAIAYPLALDMAPFLDPDSPDVGSPDRCEFSLFAVACHAGRLGSGHYTALVRSALNGSWWRADDGSVMELKTLSQHHGRADPAPASSAARADEGHGGETDEEDAALALQELEELVQSRSAYVLFYLRTSELPKASEALRARLEGMGVTQVTEAPVPAASQGREGEPGTRVTSRRSAGRRRTSGRSAAAGGAAQT